MDFKRYKVVIVGDAGVGKTSLINQLLGEDFSPNYNPTFGVDVKPICFQTNRGIFVLDMYDSAGQEKFYKFHWANADACIAVYDVTSKLSEKNMWDWIHSVEKVAGKIPTVLCGNKIDIKRVSRYENEDKYFTSSKLPYTVEDLFMEVLREITGFRDLDGGSQMKNSQYYE